MINIQSKDECCGCEMCLSVCPKQCISLIQDTEGFYYPKVSTDLCIKCNMCSKLCKEKNYKIESFNMEAYACNNKDSNIQKKSSSGGIFNALANMVLELKGVVFGVKMSDDYYEAVFEKITDKKDIYLLMGSKYIQAKVNNVYNKVKDELDSGKLVLFTGLPCHVNALNAFLGRQYENLISIDFICHGVPSPLIWKTYLKNVIHDKKIKSIDFRSKEVSWEKFKLVITHEKGEYSNYLTKDKYLRMFLKNYTLRPSCYKCNHRSGNRKSDITLGDLWGAGIIVSDFYNKNGMSLAVLNTEKGKNIFMKCINQLDIKKIDANRAFEFNTAYNFSPSIPSNRVLFWNEFNKNGLNKAYWKYCFVSKSERIKYIIKSILRKV